MEIGSVLFGAGLGKRLRPLTSAFPKPALPVLDVPLGTWGLAALVRAAPPVMVNASHLPERLISSLETLGLPGWRTVVETPEAYGTAGTLAALRDQIPQRVVTWNGDLVTDLDPAALLATHRSLGAPATLAVVQVASGADLVLSETSVEAFVDRRRDPGVAGARFMGAAVFERAALDRLPNERPAGLGETLLRDLATRGELTVHLFTGYWADVGTPEAYLAASLDLLYGLAPAAPIEVPGEIVSVEGGRAYVAPGARVEHRSLGPGAIVLSDGVVEPGAKVVDSIVMPHETVTARHLQDAIWFSGRSLGR